jgi:hypothetical protein
MVHVWTSCRPSRNHCFIATGSDTRHQASEHKFQSSSDLCLLPSRFITPTIRWLSHANAGHAPLKYQTRSLTTRCNECPAFVRNAFTQEAQFDQGHPVEVSQCKPCLENLHYLFALFMTCWHQIIRMRRFVSSAGHHQ